jgi:demethylmenaquinone methyltransferase/2-methoxy-6-polyprenyl-1,4-benzoquinol methylase
MRNNIISGIEIKSEDTVFMGNNKLKHNIIDVPAEISKIVETSYTDNRTKQYYAWRASNYDKLAEWEQPYHNEAVELANAKEGQRVLVAACGTGRGMDLLAKALGPTGRIDALDLSEDMLKKAQAKMKQHGNIGNIHFHHGNVRDLPFTDNVFDIVYNAYMFDLIELDGFLPILTEMKRVLKPQGKIVLLNMSKPDGNTTFYERIYRWTGIPCRPVLMAPYLQSLNFHDVKRIYRAIQPRSFYERVISKLWGQEIVIASKD